MIPQEVLDYVDFKAGSYWIYQDSATGRIDSEVVVSNRHYLEGTSDNSICDQQFYQYENIEMIKERYDSAGNLTFTWIVEFENNFKRGKPEYNGIFLIDNYDDLTIGFPFNKNYWVGSYAYSEEELDSIVINNITYPRVLKVVGKFDGINLNIDFKIYNYLSKKIGKVGLATTGANWNDFSRIYLLRYWIN